MDLVCPFVDYWWLYAAFTAFIAALLALDLSVFHRTALDVTFRESLTWSVIWVALALLFNYGFYRYAVTQHRVLFYGILGALVFRAMFIALGSVLKYALAFILIFVGLKMVWLNEAFGGRFPIEWSLGIIGALLLGAIGASLVKARSTSR